MDERTLQDYIDELRDNLNGLFLNSVYKFVSWIVDKLNILAVKINEVLGGEE